MRTPLAEVSANILPPRDQTTETVPDTPAPKRPRLQSPEATVPLENTSPLPSNAVPPSEQIPPPSTVPRRSSRVSAILKVDYFKDLADTLGDSTEDSLGDVEPEDLAEDLTEDELYISDMEETALEEDGLEETALQEVDIEENGPLAATATPSSSDKYKAFTDENGLLRIGPQPFPPSVHVKWAPRKVALSRIRLTGNRLFSATDRKIKTSVPVDHDSEQAACEEKLIEALTEYGSDGNKLTGTCDYTGADFSWASGYRSMSMEAIYSFAVKGERIAYHVSQNVCAVSTTLNWLKCKNIPIHLPLIAALIRLQDEDMPLEKRKGRLAWIFNALTNEANFETMYQFRLPHQSQVDALAKWTPEKKRDILEAARTGTKTRRITRDLASANIRKLFYITIEGDMKKSFASDV